MSPSNDESVTAIVTSERFTPAKLLMDDLRVDEGNLAQLYGIYSSGSCLLYKHAMQVQVNSQLTESQSGLYTSVYASNSVT